MFVPIDQYRTSKQYQSCLLKGLLKGKSSINILYNWPAVCIQREVSRPVIWPRPSYTAGVVIIIFSIRPSTKEVTCRRLNTARPVCDFRYVRPQHIAATFLRGIPQGSACSDRSDQSHSSITNYVTCQIECFFILRSAIADVSIVVVLLKCARDINNKWIIVNY